MKINRFDLISYATNFVSFILRYNINKEINSIILFGSVATNNFDEESDIDLFIDTDKKNNNEIIKILELYKKSEDYKKYKLFGIKNEISIKTGKLEEWKDIRRSIISNGIYLYGKYKSIPDKIKQYLMCNIELKKLNRNKKLKLWRLLYGYTQKINKKFYKFKGLIEELSGKKIAKNLFIIPVENQQKLIYILKKNKVNYKINEIWSDNL